MSLRCLEFEFDALTGKILPVSGSGAEGTPRLNDATTDIDFSYSIDNSGEMLHTATVQFTAVAQVGGSWSQSQTGAVNITGKITGEGGSLEGGGSYSGNVGAAGADGGVAIKEDKTIVFKLRTHEDN